MMNRLSDGADAATIPVGAWPAKFPVPGLLSVLHAGLLVVAGKTAGVVGTTGEGPAALTVGNTLGSATPGSGTAGVELTPRLLISKDPNGIPVRGAPPGTVGEVDVGADDAAALLEPEPHIPDIPDVSSIPEDPKFNGSSAVTDVADGADVVDDCDIAPVPEFAAVAGMVVPIPIPPPSKLALEPNISAGGVATVEHAVLLVVVGIVIVPVAPVGSGLSPGDVISVEPSGIPVGETAEPIATPSGDVAPTVGVGVTVPTNCPSTCALAKLQTKSAGRIAAMNRTLTCILPFATISFAFGYQNGRSRLAPRKTLGRSAAAEFNFLSSAASDFRCLASCGGFHVLLQPARWIF
jgi:hypothetical protein